MPRRDVSCDYSAVLVMRWLLIGVGLALDGVPHGADDDFQVQEETPVLGIPHVKLDALLHLPELLGLTTIAAHLGPAGDAGLDGVAQHVLVDELAVHLWATM